MKGQVGTWLQMLWEWENSETFMGLILPLSPHPKKKEKKRQQKALNPLELLYILHRQNRVTVNVCLEDLGPCPVGQDLCSPMC